MGEPCTAIVAARRARRDGAARAAEAVARRSYGKLVAFLAARTRDVAGAEDALSDAFAAALADWPRARRAAIARGLAADGGAPQADRRAAPAPQHDEAAATHLQLLADELAADDGSEPALPDERLALLFACAHPAIDAALRAPLMLQTVLGFDAATHRLGLPGRAGDDGAAPGARQDQDPRRPASRFEVPQATRCRAAARRRARCDLRGLRRGWADPDGTDARRRNLADEAIWLGRLVASLLPDEPEALGLLALMLHAQARRDARRDAAGDYVPLAEQDPARWDAR